MKIIIDNQALLDTGEVFGVVFVLLISKTMKVKTKVWQDSGGLNFRINDMKGER